MVNVFRCDGVVHLFTGPIDLSGPKWDASLSEEAFTELYTGAMSAIDPMWGLIGPVDDQMALWMVLEHATGRAS